MYVRVCLLEDRRLFFLDGFCPSTSVNTEFETASYIKPVDL